MTARSGTPNTIDWRPMLYRTLPHHPVATAQAQVVPARFADLLPQQAHLSWTSLIPVMLLCLYFWEAAFMHREARSYARPARAQRVRSRPSRQGGRVRPWGGRRATVLAPPRVPAERPCPLRPLASPQTPPAGPGRLPAGALHGRRQRRRLSDGFGRFGTGGVVP